MGEIICGDYHILISGLFFPALCRLHLVLAFTITLIQQLLLLHTLQFDGGRITQIQCC